MRDFPRYYGVRPSVAEALREAEDLTFKTRDLDQEVSALRIQVELLNALRELDEEEFDERQDATLVQLNDLWKEQAELAMLLSTAEEEIEQLEYELGLLQAKTATSEPDPQDHWGDLATGSDGLLAPFQVDDRVYDKLYGTGTVVEVEPDSRVCRVAFDDLSLAKSFTSDADGLDTVGFTFLDHLLPENDPQHEDYVSPVEEDEEDDEVQVQRDETPNWAVFKLGDRVIIHATGAKGTITGWRDGLDQVLYEVTLDKSDEPVLEHSWSLKRLGHEDYFDYSEDEEWDEVLD